MVSHSVTFTDPLVQDGSDNVSIMISEEASTGVSEEGSSSVSEEDSSSVSEEATPGASHVINQVRTTVGIGDDAGTTLGSMGAATCIVTGAGTNLGSNHDIDQVGATVGAGAGVGTDLGANHAVN